MTGLLAYTPFINPLPAVHDWWYLLLVPMAVGIAMIYKAMRLPTLQYYVREVAVMTLQIIIAMIGLGIGLTILVQWIIPRLPVA